MSKFPPTSGFQWIDPKGFDLNKYTSNSSKKNKKKKKKKKMLSEYQLKIA